MKTPIPSTTRYEKRGRRYYPVDGTFDPIGWPRGAYLVLVEPGSVSTRRSLEPAYAALEAAARQVGDQLAQRLQGALRTVQVRQEGKRLPQASEDVYRAAVAAYDAVLADAGIPGSRTVTLLYPSVRDAVDEVMDFLVKKAAEGPKEET